ncbi:MAG: hypothetical protein AB1758_19755 [Candidatus Eremiobacterota bacterium]
MTARERLGGAQERLLGALLEGGAPPEGFDPHRCRCAGESLLRKRMRAASRGCPALVRALEGGFEALFQEYARACPLQDGGPRADAYRFQEWLHGSGRLPAAALPDWLLVRFRFGCSATGLQRKRQSAAFLRRAGGRWWWGVRLPWLGERIGRL